MFALDSGDLRFSLELITAINSGFVNICVDIALSILALIDSSANRSAQLACLDNIKSPKTSKFDSDITN